MRIWTLQAVVIAFLLLVGLGVANLPRIYTAKPSVKQACQKTANEMDRALCSDLSAGPAGL